MKFYNRWHFNWKFKIELMKSILIFNPYSMICCRKNKPVNIFVWGSKSHIEPGGVWQFLSGILLLVYIHCLQTIGNTDIWKHWMKKNITLDFLPNWHISYIEVNFIFSEIPKEEILTRMKKTIYVYIS